MKKKVIIVILIICAIIVSVCLGIILVNLNNEVENKNEETITVKYTINLIKFNELYGESFVDEE